MNRDELRAELTRLETDIPTATILAQLRQRQIAKVKALLAAAETASETTDEPALTYEVWSPLNDCWAGGLTLAQARRDLGVAKARVPDGRWVIRCEQTGETVRDPQRRR